MAGNAAGPTQATSTSSVVAQTTLARQFNVLYLESRREADEEHHRHLAAADMRREHAAAARDGLVTIHPAPETAAQQVEVELIAERRARRARDEHGERIQVAAADERRGGDVADLSFDYRRHEHTDIRQRMIQASHHHD
jgi:hypothetical protein